MPIRVATKSHAGGIALLGIVVRTTAFVARLVIIAILLVTRLMEDIFSVSPITVECVLYFSGKLTG
jgi:hypothetical protein